MDEKTTVPDVPDVPDVPTVPDVPGGEGTGPDENELDPAKTGADASQDEERSDAG